MDQLPADMTYELALKVPASDIDNYYEVMAKLGEEKVRWYKDTSFWAKKAHVDFGFPTEAFPFTGERFMKPHLRYAYVKNMVPSEANMKLLNEMAPHWHLSGKFQCHDLVIRDMIKEGKLKEEEVEDYLTSLEDQTLDSFFKFDAIYITHTYTMRGTASYHEIGTKKSTFESKFTKTTLFRAAGESDEDVTFHDILSATRMIAPTDYGGVDKFEYIGFSADGVPTLKADIHW